MKTKSTQFRWILLGSLIVVAIGHWAAVANRPAEEPAHLVEPSEKPVAVMDMSRLFKEHESFQDALSQIKADVVAAEEKLKVELRAIKELKDTAGDFGEPGAEPKLEEVAERIAKLEVTKKSLKAEFMKREADLYADTYEEVTALVAEYSRKRGISLVIRYRGEFDRSSRESVLAGVNSEIVFEDGIDITDDIINLLNENEAEPEL